MRGSREQRLGLAIGINVVIVAGQVVFGLLAGSLGLLSDAGHNLTDVLALILSLLAVRLARRVPTERRSFGWHRSTILAAQANAAIILVLTVWITYESIRRLIDPPPVEGLLVLIVAAVGFVGNGVAALIVREPHTHDLNMKSATLHLVSDAAASLGVAVAGAVMMATGGLARLDPAVSLLIGLSIGWQAWRLLSSSNAVLLEGTPDDVEPDAVVATIVGVPGVEAVHDVHVWSLSSDLRALSAHVVVEGHPSLEEAQAVGSLVKAELAEHHRIAHATIELECENCLADGEGPDCGMEVPAVALAHHHGHGH